MAGTGAGGRQSAGSSPAGRAAALAHLLNGDCVRLLELYQETEEFLSEATMEKEGIIQQPPLSLQLSVNEKLWLLHSALRQCLGLLEDVISREKEEFGTEDKEEYRKMRNTVKDRLGHLLQSTKLLLVEGEAITALTPDPKKLPDNSSSFGLKIWVYRVLQELIFWTRRTSETLLTLQAEREKEPGKAAVKNRRGRKERRIVRH